ncbi:MAG: AAA family ATPase [Dechloromonas sp.]|nr:MAG: AAA family ATPase [Dechloromonas sp.]
MKPGQPFADLPALAAHLRGELENKKTILLYAYNGTGRTRLSIAFKDAGKKTIQRPFSVGDHVGQPLTITETVGDTLYFNAFTEDLFHWDNDLDGDSDRRLTLNAASRFFAGLAELEMDNRIRPLLQRYADFDFRIDTQEWAVRFSRTVDGQVIDNIKVSRGEENIFVWCFFLAIVQLALDGAEAYRWVKHVYIDDPISSLDEHNAIAVANHLAQLLKRPDSKLKTVISTHHTLFFNVLCNELGKARKYFVNKPAIGSGYVLREETGDTPFFHHVAALAELYQAAQEDRLFTHHFNMLRTVLEKTASFHGHKSFSVCIKQDNDDPDGILHTRLINILSHGNYSLFEPQQMLDENKGYFRKILHDFLNRYPFNRELFPAAAEEVSP